MSTPDDPSGLWGDNPAPKFEPTQEWRAIALLLRNMYVALLDEGFTIDETFRLLSNFMILMMRPPS